ncbi:MAG TPA: ADOP family duplicated permease [Vicinamibacterales bacterium]|nr:ADOP family duplicated permease [Vicinamibacterales bacterium]
MLGRTFTETEGTIGNDSKVILSFAAWQQLFGGNPNVLGAQLRLSERTYAIVGVMPRGFSFFRPDVPFWLPLAFTDERRLKRHGGAFLYDIGKLKPDATLEQARAQVRAIDAANFERLPEVRDLRIRTGFYTSVEPLQGVLVREVKGKLYLLWGGALFVLLIGLVNVTNLALARSTVRQKEIATRLVLGASRGQVTRQLVIENVMLAATSGGIGLVAGSWLLDTLTRIGMDRLPRATEIHMDGVVVGMTLAVSFVAGGAVGVMSIIPALHANLTQSLHEQSRGGTSGRHARTMRHGLVIAQIALAFVLLTGAGLLVASFREILAVDPGFSSDGVITVATSLPEAKYAGQTEQRTFVNRFLEAVRTLPGIVSAGVTSSLPFDGDYNSSAVLPDGYVMQRDEVVIARMLRITPGYLEAMKIALVKGRFFDSRDTEAGPATCIIDERLARAIWPDRDPIGRRIYLPESLDDAKTMTEPTHWHTVVGLVRNVRLEDLAGDRSTTNGAIYYPFAQVPRRTVKVAVRADGDISGVIPAIRAEVARIDAELALFDVYRMTERVETSLQARRAATTIAMAFGLMAIFLSAIGIYGVLAYLVAQRTREIGIRFALGATTRNIRDLILREARQLLTAGLLFGAAGVVALRNVMANQLYGVRSADPIIVGVVTVTVSAVALLACTLPARRAMRVDPIAVLNQT